MTLIEDHDLLVREPDLLQHSVQAVMWSGQPQRMRPAIEATIARLKAAGDTRRPHRDRPWARLVRLRRGRLGLRGAAGRRGVGPRAASPGGRATCATRWSRWRRSKACAATPPTPSVTPARPRSWPGSSRTTRARSRRSGPRCSPGCRRTTWLLSQLRPTRWQRRLSAHGPSREPAGVLRRPARPRGARSPRGRGPPAAGDARRHRRGRTARVQGRGGARPRPSGAGQHRAGRRGGRAGRAAGRRRVRLRPGPAPARRGRHDATAGATGRGPRPPAHRRRPTSLTSAPRRGWSGRRTSCAPPGPRCGTPPSPRPR